MFHCMERSICNFHRTKLFTIQVAINVHDFSPPVKWLIPLTFIRIKGLCMSSLLLAHHICNIFRITQHSQLNMPGPSILLSNSHTDLYTHGWEFTRWSLAFIFKGLKFIAEAARELLYLHEEQRVSFVLLAGSLNVSLSLAPNADELSLWGSGRQPGLLAEEKSIRPSIASKEPLSTLPHYSPESPTSYISLFSRTWCCCVILIWWIQVGTSTNIHPMNIFVLALIFIYKTSSISFLMQQ